MKESEKNIEYNKYFRVTSSSEFEIEKEDIFYRDKYNDIINYMKGILTSDEYSAIQKYFKPKGLLLINTHPGTDILEFLKLISKNYYLDFIELNYFEILKSPLDFFQNFNRILQSIVDEPPNEDNIQKDFNSQGEIYGEKIQNKPNKLLLINESELKDNLFNGNSLLTFFLIYHRNNLPMYINNRIILIWINENLNEIKEHSKYIFQIFDLFIKVPLLSNNEREIVLKNFSEKNQKIVFDINQIVNYTQNWEIQDIEYLLKTAVFKHFLNSELNDTSNEITTVIINLIESGEFIPSLLVKSKQIEGLYNKNRIDPNKISQFQVAQDYKKVNFNELRSIREQIESQPISEFMLNQLYENAASRNYTELVIIIDKLNKKEILDKNERKLIAKYPFILNDTPGRAQINLEKAKKRIDHITQAFGK